MSRPPRTEPDTRRTISVRLDEDLLDRFRLALNTRKPRRTMQGFLVRAIEVFCRGWGMEISLPPDTMAALRIMAADQQKPIDQVIIGLIDNAPMIGREKEAKP